jgi:1,4-dihydroxy-2-naphthoate octaprenyltransferase
MASFKSWISALRPRTLFLAVAITVCGNGLAYTTGQFSVSTAILTILIATLLQLLSNLANDLGDFQHGTDVTGERLGPTRTVQSGAITPKEMKSAIVIAIGISILVGTYLVYEAAQYMNIIYMVSFLGLGGASIIAAIKYTSGKNPYGYKGLGDVFCFIFFGLVSVVGTYFLHVHEMTFQPWLPAVGMGLFSTAVLNINNMRDIENDRNSGKFTLAMRLGMKNARLYHSFLTFGGILCFITYSIIYSEHWYQYLYIVFLVPYIIILKNIYQTKENRLLDPYLKFTSMATFFLSIAFAISSNL